MAITRVTEGNAAAAQDLNQLIDLLEGSETLDYLLNSEAGSDFKIRLADAGGARSLLVQDSGGATVFEVDSDGNATFAGTVDLGTFVFPTGTSPSPTTDGAPEWDSNDNRLAVGDGSATLLFFPDVKGSNLASASSISITKRYHRVTGTTTIEALGTMPEGFFAFLSFASSLTLTHNATSLILPGETNYVTTDEETLLFLSEGSGNWRLVGAISAASSSSGSTQTVLATSDQQVSNSTTLANDLELLFALEASKTYTFEATVIYSADATPDFKCAWTVPSGSVMQVVTVGDFTTGSIGDGPGRMTSSGSSQSFDGSGASQIITFRGFVTTSVTTGNLRFQFAQDMLDGANPVTRKKGSKLTVTSP